MVLKKIECQITSFTTASSYMRTTGSLGGFSHNLNWQLLTRSNIRSAPFCTPNLDFCICFIHMFCMLCAFFFVGLVASGLMFCAYCYYYSSIPCIDCCVLLSYIKTQKKGLCLQIFGWHTSLLVLQHILHVIPPLQPLMIFESHSGPQLCNSCVLVGDDMQAIKWIRISSCSIKGREPIWWYHCLVPSTIK